LLDLDEGGLEAQIEDALKTVSLNDLFLW
jgi:hypothetical protein